MLRLRKPQFYGQAHESKNTKWIVGCSDFDGVSRGGHRDSGNGRVVLVELSTDTVVHELNCFARPMDAAVSDEGTYIVHDKGFGSTLQGDVVAINRSGQEIFRRHYLANVVNLALSECGRFAAVQTAHAESDDGNLLEVLDLGRKAVVFSTPPWAGWADDYSFEVDADGLLRTLYVDFKALGRFRYSASGEFLDDSLFQAAQLEKADFTVKIATARELLKADGTQDNARRALDAIAAAFAEGAKERPDWAAAGLRVRGEAYELLGQLPEALEAFDQALALNPKIGLQKRATALRKKLGASNP